MTAGASLFFSHYLTTIQDLRWSRTMRNMQATTFTCFLFRYSITDRGNHLKSLLHTWQTLDNRLDKLRGDLEDDKETLAILDSALQDGSLSNGMASSVRDVAKVLSETHQVRHIQITAALNYFLCLLVFSLSLFSLIYLVSSAVYLADVILPFRITYGNLQLLKLRDGFISCT